MERAGVVAVVAGILLAVGLLLWWETRKPPAELCRSSLRKSDRVATVFDGRHGTVPREDLGPAIAAGAMLDADSDGRVEIDLGGGSICVFHRDTIERDLREEEAKRRREKEEENRLAAEAEAKRAAEAEAARRAAEQDRINRFLAGAASSNVGFVGADGTMVPYPPVAAGNQGYAGSLAGQSNTAGTEVHVNGYVTKNGTVVAPHTRAAPGHGAHR